MDIHDNMTLNKEEKSASEFGHKNEKCKKKCLAHQTFVSVEETGHCGIKRSSSSTQRVPTNPTHFVQCLMKVSF